MSSCRSRPVLALALVAALAPGCSRTALITTVPSGARVTVDGQYLGTSPVELQHEPGTRRPYYVTVEKEGYRTSEVILESKYHFDHRLVAAVPFVFPYLLWTASLEDLYELHLER